jgi:hypothetical protein
MNSKKENKNDINRYLSITGDIIAVLAFFFGIQRCNDLLPDPANKLTGLYKMTFIFKECSDPQFAKGKLEAYYDIEFTKKGNQIYGSGIKHSETFNGKFMRYSKNFEIETVGEIRNGELVAKIYEDNGKKTYKVEGVIRIDLKSMTGSFNSNFFNCSGEIMLEDK